MIDDRTTNLTEWKLEALEFLITQHGGLEQIRINEDVVKELDPTGIHRYEQCKIAIGILQERLQRSKKAGLRSKMLDEIADYEEVLNRIFKGYKKGD